MECPKCHSIVDENQAVCPKCHKVLLLECPNCHSLGESSVCQNCGYTILTKCSKCSKTVPVNKETCPKCGFPTATSIAYQECESDDFASIVIKFSALKNIRRALKSKELYTKFFFRLKNLLCAQVKGVDCKFITYGEVFVINLNKELSFPTSSNKAVRLALRIINAFSTLNANVIEELGISLNLTLTIIKKPAEKLQELSVCENNVKLLTVKKDLKKYLKGMQIILDQFVWDEVNKEYKTDSLYSMEENGQTTMFYEVVLDSYVLPPSENKEDIPISVTQMSLKKTSEQVEEQDIYSFKVFDINAKCSFEKLPTTSLVEKLSTLDPEKNGKIIALKSTKETAISQEQLIKFYASQDYRVLSIVCTEEMSCKPWGFFEAIFRDYFSIPAYSKQSGSENINSNTSKAFKPLFDLLSAIPVKAMSPEDARFNYMELWGKFLSVLTKTVIIVEGFEKLDDTSQQTLEIYFDKFKKVKPNFVFISTEGVSAHSKFKGLLRTPIYTEFSLQKSSMDSCLATIKSDASDFIKSFYFEKIKENFNGSYLYFENALRYLRETGVLVDFENKLIIKHKKSVILPKDLKALYKARVKHLSKNTDISFIFAYTSILGYRLDLKTLAQLGIKDLGNICKKLLDANMLRIDGEILYVNNFELLSSVVNASLKKEAENFLAKNILAQLGKNLDDATLAFIMGRLGTFKEEYLTLWKNSQFAIKTGDFDAYLKNCLGFLSLVEHIGSNITKEDIEANKMEVYNNILLSLYTYSPDKIYFIENILLMDAINANDNEKIVKLSNLMLQGALISSNYTDAIGLLHNILSRMSQPTLFVDGEINTKFLLLSLVNIEILYNIGHYRQCVEVAEEILDVLSPQILEVVKPASFSTNLFVAHIIETLRLVAFAKLYLLDNDIEDFFNKVNETLNTELPEKDCVLAIKDYLAGKVYSTGNIEEYSAFSKVIFLILQEFSALKDDYKRFAQNIYQAKLLASDIHQKEIELFCDLLIAYAYSKIGITQKAEVIYNDVLETAEHSAIFNILVLAKYFIAKLKQSSSRQEEGLLLINNALADIRKLDNQSKVIYALFEKLYIETAIAEEMSSVDLESEEQKLVDLQKDLALILN